jgi:hypothetical protein
MSVAADEIRSDEPAVQLRSGALGLVEVVGQSLAAIAPTLTPALNISVVAGLAGIGCWMAYFIGTLGVVVVAASVGILAARHPEAGAYFVYIGRTFGPFAGALAGWAMVSAYLFTAVAVTLSFTIFLGNLLGVAGVRLGMLPMAAAALLFVAAVTFAAYRDVKLSSRAGLVLELLSIVIILVITVLFVRVQGTVVDRAQLDLSSFKYGGVFSALPFVIFSFVGFESSATLAKESANPRKNIPLAVIGCGAFAGLFFTLMAYCMVLGMGNARLECGTVHGRGGEGGFGLDVDDRVLRCHDQRLRVRLGEHQCGREAVIFDGEVPILASLDGPRARHASHAASRHRVLRRIVGGGLHGAVTGGISQRVRLCRHFREFRIRGGVPDAVHRGTARPAQERRDERAARAARNRRHGADGIRDRGQRVSGAGGPV